MARAAWGRPGYAGLASGETSASVGRDATAWRRGRARGPTRRRSVSRAPPSCCSRAAPPYPSLPHHSDSDSSSSHLHAPSPTARRRSADHAAKTLARCLSPPGPARERSRVPVTASRPPSSDSPTLAAEVEWRARPHVPAGRPAHAPGGGAFHPRAKPLRTHTTSFRRASRLQHDLGRLVKDSRRAPARPTRGASVCQPPFAPPPEVRTRSCCRRWARWKVGLRREGN